MAIKISGQTVIDDSKNAIDLKRVQQFTASGAIGSKKAAAYDIATNKVSAITGGPSTVTGSGMLATPLSNGPWSGNNLVFLNDGTDNAIFLWREPATNTNYARIVYINSSTGTLTYGTPVVVDWTTGQDVVIFDVVSIPRTGGGYDLFMWTGVKFSGNTGQLVRITYSQQANTLSFLAHDNPPTNATAPQTNGANAKLIYDPATKKVITLARSNQNPYLFSYTFQYEENHPVIGGGWLTRIEESIVLNASGGQNWPDSNGTWVEIPANLGDTVNYWLLIGQTTITKFKLDNSTRGYTYTIYPQTITSYYNGPSGIGNFPGIYSTNTSNNTITLAALDWPRYAVINYVTYQKVTDWTYNNFDDNQFAADVLGTYSSSFGAWNSEAWIDYVIYDKNTKLSIIQGTAWNGANGPESEKQWMVTAEMDYITGAVNNYSPPMVLTGTNSTGNYLVNPYPGLKLSSVTGNSIGVFTWDNYTTSNWLGNFINTFTNIRISNISKFIGITTGAVSDGQTATILTQGEISTGHSGLTPDTVVNIDATGTPVSSGTEPDSVIGFAKSSSEIMITRAYGDRYLVKSDLDQTVQKVTALIPTSKAEITDIDVFAATPVTNSLAFSGLEVGNIFRSAGTRLKTNVKPYTNQYVQTNADATIGPYAVRERLLYANTTNFTNVNADNFYPKRQSSENFLIKDNISTTGSTTSFGALIDGGSDAGVAGYTSLGSGYTLLLYGDSSSNNSIKCRLFLVSGTGGSGSGSHQFIGESTLSLTATMQVSPIASTSAEGFSAAAFDSVNSRGIFVYKSGNETLTWVTFTINTSTGAVTKLAERSDTWSGQGLSFNRINTQKSLLFIPTKQCFVFTTQNTGNANTVTSDVYRVTTTSSTINVQPIFRVTPGNTGIYGKSLVWRPDIDRLIVWYYTSAYNQIAYSTYSFSTDGNTNLQFESDSYNGSVSLVKSPNNWRVIDAVYVPDIPGKMVVMVESQWQGHALLAPSPQSTNTNWIADTTNFQRFFSNVHPYGTDSKTSQLVWDDTNKRLIAHMSSNYNGSYIKVFSIDQAPSPSTLEGIADNSVLIYPSVTSWRLGNASAYITGQNSGPTTRAIIVPTGATTNSSYCQYSVVTYSNGNPKSYIYAFRLNPVPADSLISIKYFLGAIARDNDNPAASAPADNSNTVWFIPKGAVGTWGGDWAQFNYGPIYSLGTQYYLLPGQILTHNASKTGAVKFGRMLSYNGGGLSPMSYEGSAYPLWSLSPD